MAAAWRSTKAELDECGQASSPSRLLKNSVSRQDDASDGAQVVDSTSNAEPILNDSSEKMEFFSSLLGDVCCLDIYRTII